jgi:hypothetical protein
MEPRSMITSISPINLAMVEVANGYRSRTNNKRVHGMIDLMNARAIEWPADKTGRWLGFIQGILFMEGVLDIDTERDATRPIFHEAYEIMGLEKPETFSVNKD